jgi:hypothetical protein
MSFDPKPAQKISDRDWTTHTWNKGGIRGNYQGYRDMIGSDILEGYGDDNIFDRNELNAIADQLYDIKGDSRAPKRGNYYDDGAATQDAIARLITTKGIKTTDDILQQYGLRQDQETGDIISSAGYDHSAFGAGAGNNATWEGYTSKDDFAGSRYSYNDFAEGKVPTWRYKYSSENPWEKPKKEEPIIEKPIDKTPIVIPEKKEVIPEPEVGGRGYGSKDDDPMPIRMDDWMKIGVNPGRRLGIDLTPMEQMGSIPFVTSGQYQSSLNQTIPAERKSRFYGFLDGTPGGAVSNYEDLLRKMRT